MNSKLICLNFSGESTGFKLIVPLFDPRIWAHRLKDFLEVLAWFVRFAAELLAPMEIEVRLIAVASLILIGESWIEWSCFENNLLVGCHCNYTLLYLTRSTRNNFWLL